MKLLLGKVLIETDHIESAEIVAPHTVKLYFISGAELDVHCGIESTALATWEQEAAGFIQTLLNTETYEKKLERK